jgi:flagellar secretion chaperone FliS
MMTTRNAYLEQSIQTASPARLVLALYDGAIGAVERAAEALAPSGAHTALHLEAASSNEIAHRQLVKAQNILTELRYSLDHDRGGAIAANLDALYSWCLARLLDANVAKDPSGLPPVQKVLGDLRDAWFTACCC